MKDFIKGAAITAAIVLVVLFIASRTEFAGKVGLAKAA